MKDITSKLARQSMEEKRKQYPKAGMKWDAAEDELLKKVYTDFRVSKDQNFNVFLKSIVKSFGRSPGSLKARLAKTFNDIPGWDYEREKKRIEERTKHLDSLFTKDHNALMEREYKRYVLSKAETYQKFLKRISLQVGGVEGKYITQRLVQLVGDVQKYKRDDIRSRAGVNPGSTQRQSQEEDISHLDFSGNPQAQQALQIMEETSENLFLTGEAGTGKSTLLKYFRYTTKKNVVLLAPTGVAALNVGGQTIHSFCGFKPDITVASVKKLSGNWAKSKLKLLEKLDTIVIDEISMVRADLLDCVDKFLRINSSSPNKPFGGVQIVFIGDLYQLPPVEKDFVAVSGLLNTYESPYFFDSIAFRNSQWIHIKLQQMYRQQDSVFIDLLNAIRNNKATQEHLDTLNQRSNEDGEKFTFEQFAIYLTPHNAQAKRVNSFFLDKLSSVESVYTGRATGKFEGKEPPTDMQLSIKSGAQVMMLNNDLQKRWVNGTMGKVVGVRTAQGAEPEGDEEEHRYVSEDSEPGFEPYKKPEIQSSNEDAIIIKLETGKTVYVVPHTWEMFRFALNKSTQKIESKSAGTFTQYPFKLAWAVTIHKAQGKTFNKVYLDLSTGTFAHGQLYVALSRCRTLEGIFLKRPVTQKDIILDERILKFLN